MMFVIVHIKFLEVDYSLGYNVVSICFFFLLLILVKVIYSIVELIMLNLGSITCFKSTLPISFISPHSIFFMYILNIDVFGLGKKICFICIFVLTQV